jgi:hypothetical protein
MQLTLGYGLIFNGFEKRNIMKLEKRVKQQLLSRGFTKEQLLNNRGLIGAAIDETALTVVKNLTIPVVSSRLIDKVTTTNLDLALRMVGISFDLNTIDKIIDLVELIESKGDDTSMKDVIDLQGEWSNGY